MQAIREAVSSYDHDGPEQWYVDHLVIDCDADTFWRIVEQALAEVIAGHAGCP
jgi:phosphoribosyl-AMP cyclohydrolase